MATIEHIMPIALRPLDGAGQGVFRPGLQITDGATGYRYSRDWFEYNLRSYKWQLARMGASTTKLGKFAAFLENIRMGGDACWVRDALSGTHRQMVCGPVGDASRTSYVLPLFGSAAPADLVVMVGGVHTTTHTIHPKANILTDDQANAVGGTTGIEAVGAVTITQAPYPVADGLTSFMVAPAGSAANLGLRTTAATRPDVDASQKYTFFVAVRGAGAVQLVGKLYDVGVSEVGSPAVDTGTMVTTGWTILTAEHAGHADAVKANLVIQRTATSDTNFHVACLGVIPGDLDKWFLPSESPMVVEFDTAPALNARVIAHGTEVRIARCRLSASRGVGWKLDSPGDAYGAAWSAFEELEK